MLTHVGCRFSDPEWQWLRAQLAMKTAPGQMRIGGLLELAGIPLKMPALVDTLRASFGHDGGAEAGAEGVAGDRSGGGRGGGRMMRLSPPPAPQPRSTGEILDSIDFGSTGYDLTGRDVPPTPQVTRVVQSTMPLPRGSSRRKAPAFVSPKMIARGGGQAGGVGMTRRDIIDDGGYGFMGEGEEGGGRGGRGVDDHGFTRSDQLLAEARPGTAGSVVVGDGTWIDPELRAQGDVRTTLTTMTASRASEAAADYLANGSRAHLAEPAAPAIPAITYEDPHKNDPEKQKVGPEKRATLVS